MSRPGTVRRSPTPRPPAHGSARRDDADMRLDPVRWRRPGRGTLLRLVAVAVLLATAAVVSWSRPESCTPPTGAAAVPPPSSIPAAAPLPRARSAAGPSGVPAGSVGVPVRLADPTALTLVHPGNRVDLLRLDSATGRTTAVAAAALVLEVTGPTDPTNGGLLLALTPPEARQAVTTTGEGFAILIRPD